MSNYSFTFIDNELYNPGTGNIMTIGDYARTDKEFIINDSIIINSTYVHTIHFWNGSTYLGHMTLNDTSQYSVSNYLGDYTGSIPSGATHFALQVNKVGFTGTYAISFSEFQNLIVVYTITPEGFILKGNDIRTLDTVIVNGLTYRNIFETNNIVQNPFFENGTANWNNYFTAYNNVEIENGRLKVTRDATSSSFIGQYVSIVFGDTYYSLYDYQIITSTSRARLYVERGGGYINDNYSPDSYVSEVFNGTSTGNSRFDIICPSFSTSDTLYLSSVHLVNLTNLGISNFNKEQMDELYNEYRLIKDNGGSYNFAQLNKIYKGFTTELGDGYNLAGGSYDRIYRAPSSVNNFFPRTITFNNDGTKMYSIDKNNRTIFQYSLGTPYSLSNVTYDNESYNLSARILSAYSCVFNNDGTKMFVLCYTSRRVYQYNLSTPYEISTLSYANISFFIDEDEEEDPRGLEFNNDGTKMYITGTSERQISQYVLTSAYNVNTANYDDASFSVSSQEFRPFAVRFNDDGSKMFVVGTNSDSVFQYSLSTAYEVATATYDNVNFYVGNIDGSPSDMAFGDNGKKMIVVGETYRQFIEYTMAETLTVPTEIKKVYQGVNLIYGGFSGLHYYLIPDRLANKVVYYNLITPFDLDNKGSANFVLNTPAPVSNIIISNDGSVIYLKVEDSTTAYKYDLTTPFDLSTATNQISVNSGQSTQHPTCFNLADDGKKYYINIGNTIYQYDLSTPYDITTRTQTGILNLSGTFSSDAGPGDPAFSPDGTKVVIGRRGGNTIVGGTCSTPFDLSTYTQTHTATTSDDDPSSCKWNADGTKLLVRHASPDMVNEYTVNTPYTLDGFGNERQIFDNPSFAAGGHEFSYNW